MQFEELKNLIDSLVKQPKECEWIEFKKNFHSADEIGERISAIANSACIRNHEFGYLVYGIEDESHQIVGTDFNVTSKKIKNEELENWLINRFSPKPDFSIYYFEYSSNVFLSLIIIPASKNVPISFNRQAYIRIGSATRLLHDFPEKAAKIWKKSTIQFEDCVAKEDLSQTDIISLLNTHLYFELLNIPYPSEQDKVINRFIDEGLVRLNHGYQITNIGAILFAKDLKDFPTVYRKSVRVNVYRGKNKIETIREQIGGKGYTIGFFGLVDWINSQLPANEEIGKVLREDTRMYPEIAIRELVANALIHQDFEIKGFPMIDIYSDRIEISNSGMPLIDPERFIDNYKSRNEKLADLMRRMGFCEEKGSGLDKVIFYNELYQLPPINITASTERTTVVLYAHKPLNTLDKKEKVRACYQHACLKYVSNDKMTNQSLRERFDIDDKNSAIASRIIRATIDAGLVKEEDPDNKSRKHAGYLPIWA